MSNQCFFRIDLRVFVLEVEAFKYEGFLISSWEGDGPQYVPFHFWTTAGLKKGVRHCHPYPNKSFSRLLPKCWKALAVSWRPRAVRSR